MRSCLTIRLAASNELPTLGVNHSLGCFRCSFDGLLNYFQPTLVGRTQSQHRGGKDFASFTMVFERFGTAVPTVVSGLNQSFYMGIDAFFELGQLVGIRTGRFLFLGIQQPQERRFFGVLLDDVEERGGHSDVKVSAHNVFLVVEQRIAQTADVFAFELYVERVHHEFRLVHIDIADHAAN